MGATFVAVGSDLGAFRASTQKLADTFKNNPGMEKSIERYDDEKLALLA